MGNNENVHDSFIHVPRDRSLVVRSAALAKRGLESLQTLDRIVTFPSDSIGTIFLFDRDPNVSHWSDFDPFQLASSPLGCELIDNVSCELRVPCRKYLGLGLIIEQKLPLLSSLAPDSLDGLALGGAVFGGDCYVDQLSQLKYLALLWQSAYDDTLLHLTNLKSLTHLFFYKGKIDNGLAYLANPGSLSHLGLEKMELTERAFASLSDFTSLSFLDLSRSNISDHGLSNLYSLTSLRELDLRHTEVSESGINRLKSTLPDCAISV